MLTRVSIVAGALVLVAGMLLVVGCGKPQGAATTGAADEQASASSAPTAASVDDEHAHKPGAHGGIIVTIGRDSYHAEALFEQGGTLRLLMLGKDEAKVLEVETQTFTGYAKSVGATESIAFELAPVPQPGDAEGKTSQFVGQLPEALAGQAVEVTIPSVRINGERFRLGFASATESHSADMMPDKVSDEEEVKLYLTPGGVYTDADIKANGGMTASQKFKGVMSSHDMNPKPGDKICPVTMTKASPKFTWVVAGKAYEFCCPPCVDEFVKTAKSAPDEIKAPEEYVKGPSTTLPSASAAEETKAPEDVKLR